jgi:putative flippase GtrA
VPYLPRWINRFDTLVRSAGVGAVATLADLLTLALLTHGLGVAARAASAPALCVGVAIQFVGNKRFAFRDDDPAWASQALRFAAVEALGFVALPPVALRLVTTHVVYFGVCLPLWSRIFRHPASEGSPLR